MSKRKQRHVSTKVSESKLLDIVILAFGRFDLLEKCLNSIPEAVGEWNTNYNVILVDNASPNKEEADYFYALHQADFTLVRNKENLGFPRGCNIGARRKASPLLLMLNSDVILEPKAISYMIQALEDDPKVGVVGAKLLFPTAEQLAEAKVDPRIRPAGMVQHIGLETNIRGEFYHIFLGWSRDHPKVNRMRDAYAVTGACLLTRRTIWNKIGGFFEGYGQGTFEDVDFCLTARELQYNVIVEPRAVGTHYVGATSEEYKMPMPLQMNKFLFMQRWGNRLNYTEVSRL